jgi:hypothetical protein
METYIMAKTEALSHKITQDFGLFFQRNKPLLIMDSNSSLTEIDFIVFIEITKTIIESTETFNSFAKFINNYSFFLSTFESLQHKKFTKNIKFIGKRTNQLFLLNRKSFGKQNKLISVKDFCMYQFRIHPFKPLRMPANG